MIKALLVDDSPTALEMISTILKTDSEIEVIGKVSNGREAINFLESHSIKPDIITADINMPVMNGFDMIEHIMAYNPIPILIVTVLNKDANFMRALHLGALDIIEKPAPNAWEQLPKVGMELIEKVKCLSRVKVITHLSGKKKQTLKSTLLKNNVPGVSQKIVCIGASTGGPNTLLKLFKLLPGTFPAPIFVVQHITESFFVNGMVEWFRSSLNLKVEKAEHAQFFKPSTIYISPSHCHLTVKEGKILLDNSPPVNNQKPSVDVLFESAAKNYGSQTIAIVLTGIGNDGSQGVMAVSKARGKVFAQDENSCVVFGMPKSAIATNCVEKILNIEGIAQELLKSL